MKKKMGLKESAGIIFGLGGTRLIEYFAPGILLAKRLLRLVQGVIQSILSKSLRTDWVTRRDLDPRKSKENFDFYF